MATMISGPMQVIFATVMPPLSVFCAVGLRSQFWLNLVFTLLGYVPGVMHAFHVLLSSDRREPIGPGQAGAHHVCPASARGSTDILM